MDVPMKDIVALIVLPSSEEFQRVLRIPEKCYHGDTDLLNINFLLMELFSEDDDLSPNLNHLLNISAEYEVYNMKMGRWSQLPNETRLNIPDKTNIRIYLKNNEPNDEWESNTQHQEKTPATSTVSSKPTRRRDPRKRSPVGTSLSTTPSTSIYTASVSLPADQPATLDTASKYAGLSRRDPRRKDLAVTSQAGSRGQENSPSIQSTSSVSQDLLQPNSSGQPLPPTSLLHNLSSPLSPPPVRASETSQTTVTQSEPRIAAKPSGRRRDPRRAKEISTVDMEEVSPASPDAISTVDTVVQSEPVVEKSVVTNTQSDFEICQTTDKVPEEEKSPINDRKRRKEEEPEESLVSAPKVRHGEDSDSEGELHIHIDSDQAAARSRRLSSGTSIDRSEPEAAKRLMAKTLCENAAASSLQNDDSQEGSEDNLALWDEVYSEERLLKDKNEKEDDGIKVLGEEDVVSCGSSQDSSNKVLAGPGKIPASALSFLNSLNQKQRPAEGLKPGSSLAAKKINPEIDKMTKEIEKSRKTIEQLEKEKEMLKGLQRERDRLNMLMAATDSETEDLEEGEISETDSEEEEEDGEEDEKGSLSDGREEGELEDTESEAEIVEEKYGSASESGGYDSDKVITLDDSPESPQQESDLATRGESVCIPLDRRDATDERDSISRGQSLFPGRRMAAQPVKNYWEVDEDENAENKKVRKSGQPKKDGNGWSDESDSERDTNSPNRRPFWRRSPSHRASLTTEGEELYSRRERPPAQAGRDPLAGIKPVPAIAGYVNSRESEPKQGYNILPGTENPFADNSALGNARGELDLEGSQPKLYYRRSEFSFPAGGNSSHEEGMQLYERLPRINNEKAMENLSHPPPTTTQSAMEQFNTSTIHEMFPGLQKLLANTSSNLTTNQLNSTENESNTPAEEQSKGPIRFQLPSKQTLHSVQLGSASGCHQPIQHQLAEAAGAAEAHPTAPQLKGLPQPSPQPFAIRPLAKVHPIFQSADSDSDEEKQQEEVEGDSPAVAREENGKAQDVSMPPESETAEAKEVFHNISEETVAAPVSCHKDLTEISHDASNPSMAETQESVGFIANKDATMMSNILPPILNSLPPSDATRPTLPLPRIGQSVPLTSTDDLKPSAPSMNAASSLPPGFGYPSVRTFNENSVSDAACMYAEPQEGGSGETRPPTTGHSSPDARSSRSLDSTAVDASSSTKRSRSRSSSRGSRRRRSRSRSKRSRSRSGSRRRQRRSRSRDHSRKYSSRYRSSYRRSRSRSRNRGYSRRSHRRSSRSRSRSRDRKSSSRYSRDNRSSSSCRSPGKKGERAMEDNTHEKSSTDKSKEDIMLLFYEGDADALDDPYDHPHEEYGNEENLHLRDKEQDHLNQSFEGEIKPSSMTEDHDRDVSQELQLNIFQEQLSFGSVGSSDTTSSLSIETINTNLIYSVVAPLTGQEATEYKKIYNGKNGVLVLNQFFMRRNQPLPIMKDVFHSTGLWSVNAKIGNTEIVCPNAKSKKKEARNEAAKYILKILGVFK